jgi:hypothetical protein
LVARIARWFIFRPKIPILIHFCRPRNGKCGSILWTFGTFKSSWYILWQFWYIFSHFGKFELEKSGNPGLAWTLLFLWRKKPYQQRNLLRTVALGYFLLNSRQSKYIKRRIFLVLDKRYFLHENFVNIFARILFKSAKPNF